MPRDGERGPRLQRLRCRPLSARASAQELARCILGHPPSTAYATRRRWNRRRVAHPFGSGHHPNPSNRQCSQQPPIRSVPRISLSSRQVSYHENRGVGGSTPPLTTSTYPGSEQGLGTRIRHFEPLSFAATYPTREDTEHAEPLLRAAALAGRRRELKAGHDTIGCSPSTGPPQTRHQPRRLTRCGTPRLLQRG